ncbi:MAG: hypothetical protein ACRETC_07565 [Gammaproteobacteria bacterium]
MARIELDDSRVNVVLNPLDEVLALHGSLHIPYSHIKSVSHAPVPPEWCRGIRIGTNVPGVKVAGTFFTSEGTIFYDFHDPGRCLTFELAHEKYKQVVVEVNRDQEPAALAAQIASHLC